MGMSMVQIREALREEIAQLMRHTADKLASGRAADYAQYRQSVGRIEGGRDALDAVDKVFAKYLDDDSDDN